MRVGNHEDSTQELDFIIEIKPRPHNLYYFSVGVVFIANLPLLKMNLFSLVEGSYKTTLTKKIAKKLITPLNKFSHLASYQ